MSVQTTEPSRSRLWPLETVRDEKCLLLTPLSPGVMRPEATRNYRSRGVCSDLVSLPLTRAVFIWFATLPLVTLLRRDADSLQPSL